MYKVDGKQIAEEILARLASQRAPRKFMAGFLVGDDAASRSFQQLKQRTAQRLGADYRIYTFDASETNDSLRHKIGVIVRGSSCGGALVQLPLPSHLNRQYILNTIPAEKDIDVMGERALGAFYTNRSRVLPPAAATIKEIVERMHVSLETVTAAVIGPGFLVGKPVAHWLLGKVKELIVLTKTSDYADLKKADLVICGTGKGALVTPTMLKDGVSVIDFSYATDEHGKLRGDFDASSLATISPLEANSYKLKAPFYTPTPGGTGPILVAKLFENFYTLNTL